MVHCIRMYLHACHPHHACITIRKRNSHPTLHMLPTLVILFFFLLAFWVGERGGMVLPNVDNWKLSSTQRNILLLFASSCLRSPVNWGFRTENQQQKDHVRGLKNRSGNDVTIWYIRNSYSYFYPCLPVNIHNYILTNPSIYIPILGLPLDLHHKSSKALATETKPERLERLDVSPWSTQKIQWWPTNPSENCPNVH